MKLRNCALALCMIFMTAVPCFSHDYDFGFEIAAYNLSSLRLQMQYRIHWKTLMKTRK